MNKNRKWKWGMKMKIWEKVKNMEKKSNMKKVKSKKEYQMKKNNSSIWKDNLKKIIIKMSKKMKIIKKMENI